MSEPRCSLDEPRWPWVALSVGLFALSLWVDTFPGFVASLTTGLLLFAAGLAGGHALRGMRP